MKKLWEFFENLNDVVYVSDMDNHELVYMNKKALALYNLNSVEELAGKKCYELMQHSSSPCAFCNNDKLEEGHFVEWQYYNPIVNKHYVLKDTMITDGNKRYRVDFAFDNSEHEQKQQLFLVNQSQETIATEGIQLALKAETPDKAINIVLEYLGKALHSERTYIIEKNEFGYDDNTYEWVAQGVTPEINNLQNLPPEICADWYRIFNADNNIIIEDIEQIRDEFPTKYEILKSQSIHSLVVVPLYIDKENIGFYGVDNPRGVSFEYTQNLLQFMGDFIVFCLKLRNLMLQLKEKSYQDPLTKLGNRFAMDRYMAECSQNASIGVVYCDITGLKKVNDTEGHTAGDMLILRACESLQEVFGDYGLFRIGGDELLVLCPGIDKDTFTQEANRLKQVALSHSVVLAVGAVWHEKKYGGVDILLSEPERLMYEDKSLYYENAGITRRR